MYAHVNGVDLWVEQTGEGEPVLMMHGLGLDHHYLRPYHEPLAGDARLIYYDHRWNGASGRVGEPDHAMWHADAAALLDHLGLERVTVFGQSYGSWLALGFAARYPERVSRLVLGSATLAFDYPEVVMANAQAKDPVLAARLAAAFATMPERDDDFAAAWRAVLPLYFHGAARPEMLDGTRFSAHAFALGMQQLAGFSLADRIAAIRAPIRVLVGASDFIMPPAQAKQLAAAAHDATVEVFANSGHFPFVEEPDAYLSAFRRALA
jgi:pimeloyl-ACP methyl ester carboxylesterase